MLASNADPISEPPRQESSELQPCSELARKGRKKVLENGNNAHALLL